MKFTSAQTSDLKITLEEITPSKGKIYVGVFTQSSFLTEPSRSDVIEVTGKSGVLVIKDLKHGDYAVSVFHDLNANGQFDMNEYGQPIEPWAMTGTNGKDQQPVWELAKFTFDSSTTSVQLKF
jgi:uncharacterized protein (DUF2141 family)